MLEILGWVCCGMLGCLLDQHQPNLVAPLILLFRGFGNGVCVIEGEASSSFRTRSKRRRRRYSSREERWRHDIL